VGALSAVLVVAAGCLPQERGPAREVDLEDGAPRRPPVFPDTGPVPRELLIEGLEYDFTASEADLDLWTPPADEAECAATRIVDTLGPPRLSELGYRPATSGASLNDIDLTDAERDIVASTFAACVDMRQAVASLFMGDGDMESREALCIADGLEQQDLLDPFARAWAFGRTVNPSANDGELAIALMDLVEVCLPDDAFDWPDRNLPGDDEVQGTGLGSGTTTTTLPGTEDGLQSRIGSTTTP
jgi:hypothetical protein